MNQEQYIEHEVKIRVMKEMAEEGRLFVTHRFEEIARRFEEMDRKTDKRFEQMDKNIKHIDSKLNWLTGLILSSLLMPAILHFLKLT